MSELNGLQCFGWQSMAVEMLAQSANYGSFSFILFNFSRRFFFTVITAQNTATMLLEGRANKFTVAKKNYTSAMLAAKC